MTDIASSRQPRDGGADDSHLISVLRGWLRAVLKTHRNGESARDTLDELIEERDESEVPIDAHERNLLSNVLHLRDVTAYDVMVPRADITAVEVRGGFAELVKIFTDKGHSRLPVYRGTLDDAIGMVHIKDVLPWVAGDRPFVMSRILRKVLFVSPSVRVLDLLVEMRLKRTHMALVVDEYGGIDGLVTIEDLVEQIVGEIEDEHDREVEPDLVVRPDGVVEADARTTLEQFEEKVGPLPDGDELREEDVDTLGGLVFLLAGRVPSRGELIAHPSGMEFEIVDADPRRIKRLRVRGMPPRALAESA